jgi:hypothetical protein
MESNQRLMLTRQLLYHLTKAACVYYTGILFIVNSVVLRTGFEPVLAVYLTLRDINPLFYH